MTRQQLGEGLLTIGSIGVLGAAIMAIDWQAREQVSTLVQDRPLGTLGSHGAWLYGMGSSVLDTVRYQSIEHAPLTVFFVVAMVLLLFMIRT